MPAFLPPNFCRSGYNASMVRAFALLSFAFFVGLPIGCRQDQPSVATATPLVQIQPPTDAPQLSTQTSSSAPTPPSPTPTAPPPTPLATPTLSATATPIPTTTPIILQNKSDFGDDRSPFTGEIVAKPANLARRPIAVKISNAPPQHVRPQSGLSHADLVYEHVAEGATRFTAIFHSQTPPDLGSVRSARLIDLELPAMYDAALVYSGASIGVSRKLNRVDFNERLLRATSQGFYRTGADKPWEHTLFIHPEQLWLELDDRELNRPPNLNNFMSFSQLPLPGGEPAPVISIRYSSEAVEWRYDPENGRYWRWAGGEPHLDANTNGQLSAANIVVIFAVHQVDDSICEHQVGDECVSPSVSVDLMGSWRAILLRDGMAYAGMWTRPDRHGMLTLQNGAGEPLPFQIGNSWFQVMPAIYENRVTIQQTASD